jgi:hypothetical protein
LSIGLLEVLLGVVLVLVHVLVEKWKFQGPFLRDFQCRKFLLQKRKSSFQGLKWQCILRGKKWDQKRLQFVDIRHCFGQRASSFQDLKWKCIRMWKIEVQRLVRLFGILLE